MQKTFRSWCILLFSFLLVATLTLPLLGDEGTDCQAGIYRLWVEDLEDNDKVDGNPEDTLYLEEGDEVKFHITLQITPDFSYGKGTCTFGLKLREHDSAFSETIIPFDLTKQTTEICGMQESGCDDDFNNRETYTYTWAIEDIPEYKKKDGEWKKVGDQWDELLQLNDNRLEVNIIPVTPGEPALNAERINLKKQ